MTSNDDVVMLATQQFLYSLDLNTNIISLITGPLKWVPQSNEKIVAGPFPFIKVPPGYYCVIRDPCSKYEVGKPPKTLFGQIAIKVHGEPFPLYPGEELVGAENFGKTSSSYGKSIQVLPIVKANQALQLLATVDHKDGKLQRHSGDRWQLDGPMTYVPTPYVTIEGIRQGNIIAPGHALRLRAVQGLTDRLGRKRVTGEEWIITEEGAYLPDQWEEVVAQEPAIVLTQTLAVHLVATINITDSLGKERKTGEEWLVTYLDTDTLYPQIGVQVVKTIGPEVLRRGEFCVVLNPVDKHGRYQLGKREIRKGVTSFFLHPGEELEHGIEKSFILASDEALVLMANEEFEDLASADKPVRQPGELWMITGPAEYIPPVEVKVITKRKSILLSKNEGIYVRDIQSGSVRSVMGPCSYMLEAQEELFENELDSSVEEMLRLGGGMGSGDIRKMAYFEQSIDPTIIHGRDKTKVVTFRCPGNTACQIYNYKKMTIRTIFGPDLVVLGPYESFCVLSLSAGKPKKANALKSLVLMLGPDFISDIIEVETSDHARLSIQLAFNNHFEFEKDDPVSHAKIFSVPDFIGFACKQIGRIRATIAQTSFDEFHRNSADIVKYAVFGTKEDGSLNAPLKFSANQLVISSVDVQSIEPVDLKMRESLMRSVQMAIEISTKSIEAAARHEAERVEQKARGELDRQKLQNEMKAEEARSGLIELRAITAAVESTGQAVAEARAIAESQKIEGLSQIECTKLRMEAAVVEHNSQMEQQKLHRAGELAYHKALSIIEIDKSRQLAKIQTEKFKSLVDAIGTKTIQAVANAGPALQVKLLKSLGLDSALITDGHSPINLFNAAQGLVAQRAIAN